MLLNAVDTVAVTQHSPHAQANGKILLEIVVLMAATQYSPRARSFNGSILHCQGSGLNGRYTTQPPHNPLTGAYCSR
jgi:hypothetical protein